MTTSTSLSGRTSSPRAPAKGSFPLDHLGECKSFADIYETCIRANNKQVGRCREEARKYLQCRMNAGLMAKDEWGNLGLEEGKERTNDDIGTGVEDNRQEAFVSGMRLAKRRKERYKRTEGAGDDAG